MGTLGRDVAFWLFAVSVLGAAVSGSFALWLAALFFALAFFYHFLAERPKAVWKSRVGGLQGAALIPLLPPVARLHLLLSGRKAAGRWDKAYEIHVPGAGPNFIGELEKDLVLIVKRFPRSALYFWETAAPVPSSIRMLIREREKHGKAYWIKGASPLPKAFTGGFSRKEKRHVRRGAIFLD